MPQNDIECESFTVIFIDSLLVFENKYDLNNCAYKIANKQITDYLDGNFLFFLKIRSYKFCST